MSRRPGGADTARMVRVICRRRLQDERGASLVELTLAIPLLVIFLLAIISYGIILSFKQGMTQVAAEAARAGAVAGAAGAEARATTALGDDAARVLDRDCGTDGLTCEIQVLDCAPPGTDCRVEVVVRFDNASNPLAPPIPLLSAVLPRTMTAKSVVRVSGS